MVLDFERKKQDKYADPAAAKMKGIESIEGMQVILSELYVSMAGSAMDVLQSSHGADGFFRDMGNALTEQASRHRISVCLWKRGAKRQEEREGCLYH